MLNIDMIQAARERIAPRIHRTPVVTSRQFNEVAGKEVFFKCENFQRAGAFKIRGATNKIQSLTDEEKRRGIVAFSSGNHAQAVALAGREAGVRALIAMPDDAPQAKVAATREYGAEVVFYDRQKQDREAFALDLAERERLVMVPPYDDELILAGQANVWSRVAGRSSGSRLRVGAVQRRRSVCGRCDGGQGRSIRAFVVSRSSRLMLTTRDNRLLKGERVTIPPPATIADGFRVQIPGRLTFPIVQQLADDVLTVTDEEIIETLRFMLFRMKMLVETSGATAAAAVMFRKLPADVKRVGVVLSGGNIDPGLLVKLLSGNRLR